LENVKLLIDAGADINHQDSKGNTPACYAAAPFRRYSIVYFLLTAGSDWSLQDDFGYDLSTICLRFPQKDKANFPEEHAFYLKVLKFLEDKGVDLEAAEKRKDELWNRKVPPPTSSKK